MSDKITMSWTDWRERERNCEVEMELNARDFRGTPIYPWLVIAANRQLPATEIERFLRAEAAKGLKRVERPLRWIRRKRWMAQLPNTTTASGPKANRDGQDASAIAIMRANPRLSARALARLIKDNGIQRGKDWVCLNRWR